MRIFCLCLVKNEADILEEAMTAAAQWADGIYIADNESDDDTPKIIDRLAARLPNVFNAGTIEGPFRDDMRGDVFERVKAVSRHGDWWCKIDADEFLIDDPRAFLAALPPQTDTVWGSFYTYYFTQVDLQRYEADPERFLATPIRDRFDYYKNNESEIRFVKHTTPFIWKREWPKYRCAAYPKRVRFAHYRYRSPEQIVRRLSGRRQIAQRTGGGLFPHELGLHAASLAPLPKRGKGMVVRPVDRESYRERVVDAATLDHGLPYVDRESDLRRITDIWPTAVPFWLWKPYCIASSSLSLKRYIPGRVKRLFRRTR